MNSRWAVVGALAFFAACNIAQLGPGIRYSCTVDTDCPEGERCDANRCSGPTDGGEASSGAGGTGGSLGGGSGGAGGGAVGGGNGGSGGAGGGSTGGSGGSTGCVPWSCAGVCGTTPVWNGCGGTMQCGGCDSGLPRDPSTGVVFQGMCSDGGWCWQNPVPHGQKIIAATAISRDEVWVVGVGGIIGRWSTKGWEFFFGPGTASLRTVAGNRSDNVWMMGSSPSAYHWNGNALVTESVGAAGTFDGVAVASDDVVAATNGTTITVRSPFMTWAVKDVPDAGVFGPIIATGASTFVVGGELVDGGGFAMRVTRVSSGAIVVDSPVRVAGKLMALVSTDGGSVIGVTSDGRILELTSSGANEVANVNLPPTADVAVAGGGSGAIWVATKSGSLYSNAGVADGGFAFVETASGVTRVLTAAAVHRSDSAMFFGDLGESFEVRPRYFVGPTHVNLGAQLRYWGRSSTSSDLKAVTGFQDQSVRAVGSAGAVLSLAPGANTWSLQPPTALAALNKAVWGLSADDYWVVSAGLATQYVSGVPRSFAAAPGIQLSAVSATSSGVVRFVGINDAGTSGAVLVNSKPDSGVLVTAAITNGSLFNQPIQALCHAFDDWDSYFYAVGPGNASLQFRAANMPPSTSIVVENVGLTPGASSPPGFGAIPSANFTSVLCSKSGVPNAGLYDRTAWIACDNTGGSIIRYQWTNGNVTYEAETRPGLGGPLYGIGGVPGVGMWAVGAGAAQSAFRRFYNSEKEDSGWVAEPIPTSKRLFGVWVSPYDGGAWAVGDDGTILHRSIP